MNVFLPISVVTSFLLLAACGTQNESELAGSKNKFRITCDIQVTQSDPGKQAVTVKAHVQGKKTYPDTATAYADADEIFQVTTAADKKCSNQAVKVGVNSSACGQIAAHVTTGNIGLFNRIDLNNGLSTGFYQCQTDIVK